MRENHAMWFSIKIHRNLLGAKGSFFFQTCEEIYVIKGQEGYYNDTL
jgi:hypothetical protein